MALQKRRAGDPLSISARDWRQIDQAVDYTQRAESQVSGGPFSINRQTAIVHIFNGRGADVDRHGVLGIDGVLITEGDNAEEYASRPSFEGVLPITSEHLGKFVVLLEPIRAGGIGRAVLTGVAVATINVQDGNHTHADVDDSNSTRLASGFHGSARILYKPAGTGDKLCVVSLGHYYGPTCRPFTATGPMGGGGLPSNEANVTFDDVLGGSGVVYDRYGEYGGLDSGMSGHANFIDGKMEIIGIDDCNGYTT